MKALAPILIVVLSGCAAQPEELPPKPIDLQPGWREYALANYQHVVKRDLVSPYSAVFEGEPAIDAHLTHDGKTELKANGIVNSTNAFGAMLTGTYLVWWTQKPDGGWGDARCWILRDGGDFARISARHP